MMVLSHALSRLQGAAAAVNRGLGREKYSVFLDSTNGCNLRCSFCTRNSGKVTIMSAAELDTVLAKIHRRTESLQLSCAWEYSIDGNAAELVRTLGRYRIPSTTIYTNGNILGDDLAQALVQAQIGEFVVSIGEAQQETYERLRAGGKFQRVTSNLRKLADLKERMGSALPVLCCNLTLVNSNLKELVDFVDLAASLGVQRIVGRHLILNEGLDMSGEIIVDGAAANGIIAAAEKRAERYGISFSVPRYQEELQPKRCRAPWKQLYISSNGDVSVCPRIHKHVRIGNLLTDTLAAVTRGSAMRGLKLQFSENRFTNPVCGICMENRETVQAIDQGF